MDAASKHAMPKDAEFVFFALSRAGYGPRPGDVAEVSRTGFTRWVDEQLHPDDSADTAFTSKLAATLPIKYAAGSNLPDGGGIIQTWPAVDE